MPQADARAIDEAAAALVAGELVAFPTETVYGLGARADDDAAVARIFAAKGRPADHPLIVHVADADSATWFGHLGAQGSLARRLAQAFWPGPLTVIVPRRTGRAAGAAGGQDSIGLRVPSHPVALAWLKRCAEFGVPGVAGPSANRFGRVSPTRAAHVQAEFGAALRVLDGGACAVGIESAIVDCTRAQPALLRPGQLGRAALEAVLGQPLVERDSASPRAPGMLVAHYAPVAPVRLFHVYDGVTIAGQAAQVIGVYSRHAPPGQAGKRSTGEPACRWRPMPADPAAVAHELFAVLRDFDDAGVVAIWVETPPAAAAWDGVRDRLRRAAVNA